MSLRQSLLVCGCFIVALLGCGRKPLTPAAPWTDVVEDTLYFLATTTDPGGLKIEYMFDWGDGQLARTTRRYESGDTAYIRHTFTDPAWCEVRVQASNENGKSSAWSPPLRFRKSHAPVISDDTICGLVRWAVNRWYRASAQVTDPDGDSVSVKFIWDGDEGGTWTELEPSGSTFADSCLWTTTGLHTLKVVARDKGNMVARSKSTKTVNVSEMAIVWNTYNEETYYDATPTLGLIDGEPVLYCGVSDVVDCRSLDGRLRWSTVTPNGSGYAPSISADGSRLYLSDFDSGLVCLDSRTGRVEWCLDSCVGFCTPAIGPDGAIYVFVPHDCISELYRVQDCGDSAAVQWGVPLGDYGYVDNGVAIGRNGVVYTMAYDGLAECSFLVALDSNGRLLWQDSARIKIGGTPVIDSHDRLLIADMAGGLYCLNPDGTLAWSTTTGELDPGSVAIGHDDEVIVTDNDGRVRRFDSNGQERWASNVGIYGGNTSCVTQDSTVLAFDAGGSVFCIDKAGQILWEFSIRDSLGIDRQLAKRFEGQGQPSPVIGPDGDLYLATDYGLVRIAHGGLKMANTAWPTYNHDNAHSGWAGRP